MKNQIDPSTIKKIAKLAKLKLTNDEVEKYAAQLSNVFELFEGLKEVDTTGVDFLSFPEENSLRDDVSLQTFDQVTAISQSNIKDEKAGGFKVKSVLGKAT